MHKVIPKEIREQILSRIKNGTPVVVAARDAGISDKTVYRRLGIPQRLKPLFPERNL